MALKKWYEIGKSYIKGEAILSVHVTGMDKAKNTVINLDPNKVSNPKYCTLWCREEEAEEIFNDIRAEMNRK